MATIREIAKLAELSPGAVSRILNQDETLSVSDSTRQKVLTIAKELNYTKPLKNSHIMEKGKTFTMGLVEWMSAEEGLQDPYYLAARQGIEEFCTRNNITIIHAFPNDPTSISAIRKVDGLVCIGKFSNKEIKTFQSVCSNLVFLDMSVSNPGLTSISMDFNQAVVQVLDYFFELGHTDIAFLGGQEYVGEHESLIDPRKKAFIKYMKNKKLEYKMWLKEGSFSSASGYEMMKDVLSQPIRPTAVFAASDSIAIGAMKAISEQGLSIPKDISIIGFNNDEISSYLTPPLTTIHAPAYDMGQHGANLVFSASNLCNQTSLKVKIPCSLIIRESCRKKQN